MLMRKMVLQHTTMLLLLLLLPLTWKCTCTSTHYHGNSSDNATNMSPCHQSISLRHKILAVIKVIIFITGVIGNSVSILVILASRNLRSQIAYLFIVSLALADLGVIFFATTFRIDINIKNGSFCHDADACIFFFIADTLFPSSSITHVLIIAIDRWYAITYPVSYVSHTATTTPAKYVIGFVWLYATFWASIGMFNWKNPSSGLSVGIHYTPHKVLCFGINQYYHTAVVALVYFLPMSATTCLYIMILVIAMKQAAAMSKYNVKETKSKGQRIDSYVKAASIVFATYVIFWLPNMVIVMISYWRIELMLDFHAYHELAYDIITTIMQSILPSINSCVNPFIYFLFAGAFRAAFIDLIRKLLKKPRHDAYAKFPRNRSEVDQYKGVMNGENDFNEQSKLHEG